MRKCWGRYEASLYMNLEKKRSTLHARSLDAALLVDMRSNHYRESGQLPGRLHSLFTRVINLETADGNLLTLACGASDNAPASIVVDTQKWSEYPLSVGDPVHFSPSGIRIGQSLFIEFGNAQTWVCQLPPYAPTSPLLTKNCLLARAHLQVQGNGLGLVNAEACALTRFEKAQARAFRLHTQGLCRALLKDDAAQSLRHINHLVGLGPGLTPAGDDFLLGLLAVLHLPESPRPAWQALGAQVMACAAMQTNAISLAALQHAAYGKVRESLVRLCTDLLYAETPAMYEALDRVLSIGASSGCDMVVGMLAGFELHERASALHFPSL